MVGLCYCNIPKIKEIFLFLKQFQITISFTKKDFKSHYHELEYPKILKHIKFQDDVYDQAFASPMNYEVTETITIKI